MESQTTVHPLIMALLSIVTYGAASVILLVVCNLE